MAAFSKAFPLMGLLFAVLLILSPKVSGRKLAEPAQTMTEGSVEDVKQWGLGHWGFGHGKDHWGFGHGKGDCGFGDGDGHGHWGDGQKGGIRGGNGAAAGKV